MDNRDHNFSFKSGETDDPETLLMECLSTLEVVRHVFRAPEDDPPPTAEVLNGVSSIVAGVMATLDTIYEHIAAEARDRRLLHERPSRAHNKALREFEERWGADAAGEMLEFIVRHYARAPDGESEGPDKEADDAHNT